MIMRFFITLLFCTFFGALSAQNKTGVWYGAIVFEPDGVREVDSEPRIRVDAQAGRIVNVPPIYAGSMSLSKSRTYTKAKLEIHLENDDDIINNFIIENNLGEIKKKESSKIQIKLDDDNITSNNIYKNIDKNIDENIDDNFTDNFDIDQFEIIR